MKKIILLTFITLMIFGCSSPTHNIDAPFGGSIITVGYNTIIIDSCEYISGAYKLAHKGNCRFCEERRKKKLEELVIKLTE